MKLLVPIMNFFILFLVSCCGCARVPVPTNSEEKEDSQEEILTIIFEKDKILDTEPVIFEVNGSTGTVKWYTIPENSGIFEPPEGERVIFLPNNIFKDTQITIIAEDEADKTDEISIMIIDQTIEPSEGDILINEIGWAGSMYSAYDEYIELINKSDFDIYMYDYQIENAAGAKNTLTISGKIMSHSVFLITNYPYNDDRTAINNVPDFVSPQLSLNNGINGPFILKSQNGNILDSVGNGESYIHGINSQDEKSSMSRYTWSVSFNYKTEEWYTESISLGFKDGTMGTPGEENSDIPIQNKPVDDDARAIITEYYIDYNRNDVTDWVELYITRRGSIENFVVTDLDNLKSDSSISGGEDIFVEKGDYICVIWGEASQQANEVFPQDIEIFYIPDVKPTGTKDELVLMISGSFMDGLCYYSIDEPQIDDEQSMRDFGWTGEPIFGKHGSRIFDSKSQTYLEDLNAGVWQTEKPETPGY